LARISKIVTVLFGTVGFNPTKFLAALSRVGNIDKVVFYTGVPRTETQRRRIKTAQRTVIQTLKRLELPWENHVLDDPWDFNGVLREFLKDLQDYRDRDVVFNISGGPKTVAVAASVAAMFLRLRVIYFPEKGKGTPVWLPVRAVPDTDKITSSMLKVLMSVEGDGGACELKALARKLGRTGSTLDYHLTRLEQLGAVSREFQNDSRRDKVVRLTDTGRFLLLLRQRNG